MVEESATGDGATGDGETPPDAVSSWVARRAEECGVSEATFLRQLAARLDREREAGSVADLDEEMHDLVRDVRERVLQVKRATAEKADADHDHDDLRASLAAVEGTTDTLAADVARLDDDVEALEERLAETAQRVDRGFENYEEVLDYLTETTEDLDAKTRTLARAVVDLREAVADVAAADTTAVDALAREANRAGVTVADCQECGSRVHVTLLRESRCPHCRATFTGVRRQSRRLLGSHTLLTADERPELEAGDEEAAVIANADEVADIADAEGGEP